jgi:acetate---CoA ligase (ADP-forming) subunit beta
VNALTEWESKQLLGARLPRPREALTTTAHEAVSFAEAVGGPVVAKASGVAHKTETGGVRVGLDPAALAACWAELAEAGDGSVLVAEQVRGDLELVAGGLRDPQFGPLVSIGLRGVLTEVLHDVAFMLAPPEPGELDAAIARLRSAPLFAGYRNRPAPDRELLADILDAIADLLVADPSVSEIDCNPIIVRDGVPLVVDALVVRA